MSEATAKKCANSSALSTAAFEQQVAAVVGWNGYQGEVAEASADE